MFGVIDIIMMVMIVKGSETTKSLPFPIRANMD